MREKTGNEAGNQRGQTTIAQEYPGPRLSDQRFGDQWRKPENLRQVILKIEQLCPDRSGGNVSMSQLLRWGYVPLKVEILPMKTADLNAVLLVSNPNY